VLNAFMNVNLSTKETTKKQRLKDSSGSNAGKWVIAAHMADVQMTLQEMIDAVPSDGGTIVISEGVYDLAEPLQIPADGGHVTIQGCMFNGADKYKEISPAKVRYGGVDDVLVYWNEKWKSSVSDAKGFPTKEAADEEAFMLVAKLPKYIGSVHTVLIPA
jgi:hypothetical protein